MTKWILLLCASLAAGVVHAAATKPSAKAEMKDAKGADKGTLTITETDHGVQIVGDLKGIPAGPHGFHIHETGTCTAPDFKSAGGHFNPDGHDHGDMSKNPSHNGDMRNIEVGTSGQIHIDLKNTKVTLKPDAKNSLLKQGGTALVLHAKADDYKTQPSGDAGDRILCGVIR